RTQYQPALAGFGVSDREFIHGGVSDREFIHGGVSDREFIHGGVSDREFIHGALGLPGDAWSSQPAQGEEGVSYANSVFSI
ncbi:MAG: hypothetical protein WAV74_20545, partial [Anaerolineae bacterium]